MKETPTEILNELFNKLAKNKVLFDLKKKEHKPILTKALFISFILSLGAIALLLKDLKLALSLMLVIGVHEFGHLWVAKKMDLNTNGFIFIPLFGGAASISYHNNAYNNFMAIIGGPIFGLILNIFLAIVHLYTKNEWVASTVRINTIINMFNLLPLGILDGGKIFRYIMASFPPIIGFFGLVLSYVFMVGFFLYYFSNPVLLLLIVFFGIGEFLSDYNQLEFYEVIQKDKKMFWDMFRYAEIRLHNKETSSDYNLVVTYKGKEVCRPLSGVDSIFALITWITTAILLILIYV
jgi:Zn-dependent protease